MPSVAPSSPSSLKRVQERAKRQMEGGKVEREGGGAVRSNAAAMIVVVFIVYGLPLRIRSVYSVADLH